MYEKVESIYNFEKAVSMQQSKYLLSPISTIKCIGSSLLNSTIQLRIERLIYTSCWYAMSFRFY